MPPKKIRCYECNKEATVAVSNSDKNPNRPYYKCMKCPNSSGGKGQFLGWFDGEGAYTGKKPEFKGGNGRNKFKKPVPESSDTEKEESEEEDESPKKKRKRTEETPEPAHPFLDKFTRDKVLQNSEQLELFCSRFEELSQKIETLIQKIESK